jgi:lathosterol oxidase
MSDFNVHQSNKQFRLGEGRISGYLSLVLGTLSLFAAICFLFPEFFTTPDLRKAYPLAFLRKVLFFALVLSFSFGLLTFILNKKKRMGIVGMLCSTVAILLGGWQIEPKEFDTGLFYLGLDWAVLDLVVLALIFIPLEKIFPKRDEQIILRLEWQTDLVYFCIGHFFIQIIALVTITPSAVLFGWLNLEALQSRVSSWPFVLQFFCALLLTDLAQYTMHRFFHGNRVLWRFHAIHHSIKSLDWLAASRLHFVDIFVTRAFGFIPIFVMGFSRNVVIVYVIFIAFQAVLIHSNTSINFGFLKYVFVTPQYHHWHHSDDPKTYNKNFAVHLPLIDFIFGSYYLPGNEWPASYGIHESLPVGYLRQLVHPFMKKKTGQAEQ